MHRSYLLLALEQAFLGLGFCAPNPSVGAIAVCDGHIVARGYHKKAGAAHAEVEVLDKLTPTQRNIGLYITLEPCNHWGKTPPCTEAIIQAHKRHGVKEVVFAYRDPNPVVCQNNSVQILREAGINVQHYPVAEIDDFYKSYQRVVHKKMPYVRAKLAMDLAGNTAAEGGRSEKITGALADHYTHTLRKQSDVILTTAQTVLCDNPRLNARIDGQVFAKPIIVLDTQARLSGKEAIFSTGAAVMVFTGEGVPSGLKTHSLPKTPNGGLCLASMLACVAEMGYHSVWVEAGARLFNALHADALVQESLLYISARNLGVLAHRAELAAIRPEQALRRTWQTFDETAVLTLYWGS